MYQSGCRWERRWTSWRCPGCSRSGFTPPSFAKSFCPSGPDFMYYQIWFLICQSIFSWKEEAAVWCEHLHGGGWRRGWRPWEGGSGVFVGHNHLPWGQGSIQLAGPWDLPPHSGSASWAQLQPGLHHGEHPGGRPRLGDGQREGWQALWGGSLPPKTAHQAWEADSKYCKKAKQFSARHQSCHQSTEVIRSWSQSLLKAHWWDWLPMTSHCSEFSIRMMSSCAGQFALYVLFYSWELFHQYYMYHPQPGAK